MHAATASGEPAEESGGKRAAPALDARGGLRSASFVGLALTQFLGAVNDNTFRLLVVGVGTAKVAAEHSSVVLSAGLACFTLPYLLLAAPAGYLADRLSKRKVIVACKAAEIAIMLGGVVAIWIGELYSIFVVLGLMGAQSALFGPAKLGSIPEMLRPNRISAANGVMGLVTIVATVSGVAAGNALFRLTGPDGTRHVWATALVLVGVAVAGTATSLLIRTAPAASPQRNFPWDLATQAIRDLKSLALNRALLRVALGVAFFWSLGALAQSNILEYGAEGGLLQHETNPLLAAMVIGVGLGSVLAGVWSGGKIELGILPIGAAGIAVFALLLFTVSGELVVGRAEWTAARIWACVWLFGLGTSAGLFNVPLESYMQHRSPPETRGSILAASNFLTFGGMLAAAGLFVLLRAPVFEPQPDRLPALTSLPAEEQARIAALRRSYEAAWDATLRTQNANASEAARAIDLPNLAAALASVASEDRALALRELALVDRQRMQALRLRLPLKSYRADFRDDADLEIIRTVLDEPAPLFTARQVFLLAGGLTIPVFLYIVWLIPIASLRFAILLASKTIYRVKVVGLENLPERGGALVVPNHVSWLDGVLLLITSSRPIRMVAHAKNVTGGWTGRLARVMGVIPIDPVSKSSVRKAIETAREALARGELVCIFPEGHITRTGEMGPFKRGMLAMAEGTGAPILPVYLDQLWGSIFSYYGGRLFWKWPRRWPYPVTILFGRPVVPAGEVEPIRQAVLELRRQAMQPRMEKHLLPPREFIRLCRQQRSAEKIVDSTGQKATGGQLLARTLVLRRLLLRHVLKEEERYVGVLLPPSLGAVVVNAALPLLSRVAVNLNYTLSKAEMDHCLRECNIRHVLTSRRVMEKVKVEVGAELVYLDDFKEKVTLADKLVAGAMAYAMPRGMLERKLGLDKIKPDDLLTVIFTSGSTGVPKGVMLTHKNIGSNVAAVQEAVHLRHDDVLLGTLPFFHSFGYTVTMWTVMMLPPKGVYHFSPLDARAVGKLSGQHGVTILVTTPTFLRSYVKRCTPEEFSKLDVVVAGAEKLPKDLIDAFEEKYKVRPVEGYGTTELAPLVSVNIPPHRSASAGETVREGSVGRCVPGIRAKVVHPDTEQELGPDEEGMLLVTGPNVMAGYLNCPEKTAEVMRDGWYVTGDIARIDRDGFIWITGRLSRFSKIGGEMVPHLRVEEVLSGLVSDGADEVRVAVTAVPCPRKGERLVVVHLPLQKTPDQLCKELSAAGLPNLFIPSPDSFCEVEQIPLLGSGKLDLKALKQLALEKFAVRA